MISIKAYETFINESTISISVMNSETKFLKNTLETANSDKKIKGLNRVTDDSFIKNIDKKEYRSDTFFKFSIRNLKFKTTLLLTSYVSGTRYTSEQMKISNIINRELNPAIIFIESLDTDDLSILDDVFVETIKASYKTDLFTFTRISDYEKIEDNCYIIKYKSSHEKGETITAEQIINSKAVKQLLKEFPLEITSTDKQLKNLSIVFSMPSKYVHTNANIITTTSDKAISGYLSPSYCMGKSGWIHQINRHNSSDTTGKSFDSSTLAGWEKGVETIKKMFMSLFLRIQRDYDADVYYSEEDLHNYRGKITGKSYGV